MNYNNYRINDKIRISPINLIDENGNNLGIVALIKAKELARGEGLDLVEVSPQARPPVCKIMNFGKFKYNQEIKNKKQKIKTNIKEIRLSCGIENHDLETKAKHTIKFLSSDYKVNIKLEFRKRENNHKEIGFKVIDNFLNKIKDFCTITKSPSFDGKCIFCSVESKKK